MPSSASGTPGFQIAFTIFGWSTNPRLAIAEYAVATCIGVADSRPWPIASCTLSPT